MRYSDSFPSHRCYSIGSNLLKNLVYATTVVVAAAVVVVVDVFDVAVVTRRGTWVSFCRRPSLSNPPPAPPRCPTTPTVQCQSPAPGIHCSLSSARLK